MAMKRNSIYVFDIDGTLCPSNEPVSSRMRDILAGISENAHLVLASGRPFGCTAGLCRQLGLLDVMVIGENGATLTYGAQFPPTKYYKAELSDSLKSLYAKIRKDYELEFGERIWFQPNEINLTVFPMDRANIGAIHAKARNYSSPELDMYLHKDCVDFVPVSVDKGLALLKIMNELGIIRENVYAFGDGQNDVPLFAEAGHVITLGQVDMDLTPEKRVQSIRELEAYLEESISNQFR